MEPNSATEISTDSEFDHDPVTRKPPQIFIDDTHLRRPTRVQVKQLMLENGIHRKQNNERHNHPAKEDLGIQLDIKPLVQVDPSVLSSNRMPLKNPRPGDYLLNKAPSTEGIASKKSLELKKRYLLGETGATGIMKSGSTSVLDSKLKNFHSNISECQKLLNPAAEISPAMQMFLKTSQLGNTNLVNGKTVEEKKEVEAKNIDEKENVYGLIMNNKNELLSKVGGIIETPKSATKDLEELSETINTALIENKMKDFASVKKISGNDQKIPIIDLTSIDFPQDMIKANQKFIDDLAKTGDESNGKHYEIIDLTVDTPVKDRSLEEKDENFVTPMKLEIDEDAISKFSNKSDSKSDEEQPLISEHSKSVISEIVQSEDKVKENINEERPRSPAQETSIQVPTLISWDKKLKSQSDDLESDSLSSSSSSSLEEIPHYILDSATSPETQPGERFVPRLEVRDTSGELMQIDSLMIIDGKYVGDPEDLKLMEKLPEGTTIAVNDNKDINTSDDDPNNKKDNCDIISNTTDTTTTISSTIVDNDKDKLDKNGDKNEKIASTFKYESLGSFKKKPDLKFDTRNENKIETLMNLPMIVSADEIQSTTPVTIAKQQSIQKPTNLELNDKTNKIDLIDNDKTPTAIMAPDLSVSDSETEFTGQVLTETELSDWTADDAVSENFVDIEFALNSNRGTIKRNKKSKKKHQQQAAQANQEKIVRQQQFKEKMEKEQEQRDNAAAECGIMKNLDIENIEFMDTGSDDSCVETYSTTNKAMLKNRGYVEFVTQTPAGEHTHKSYPSYRSDAGYSSSIRTSSSYHNYNDAYMNGSANKKLDVIEAVNKEIPGVDYIEQGACILTGDFDLKTPMNEIPRTPFGIGSLPLKFQHQSEQSDSLNDIEEDSLVMITSQATTTEESDALTVVTSPLDSTPRNNNPNSFSDAIRALSREDIFNVISSDKTSSLESKRSESRKSIEDKRRQSQDKLNTSIDDARRKTSEEMSYEDYVRKLQMKISQISNARDSIDIRKGKRKSSKGDLNVDQTLSENATTPTNKVLSIFGENIKEPPTVSMKLEEITKERAKQKDLIHDLVMDKLQSKKQLNAEKRLNRSRNRQMFSPGGNNSSTPTMTTPTSSCGSIPHCHPVPPERRNSKSKLFGEPERRHSVHATSPTTPTKIFLNNHQSPAKLKDRPLSDTVNCENIEPETPKLMKTQSFCAYTTRKTPNQEDAIIDEFKTPIPPPRFGRKYDDSVTQTEKLRQEARARARLKSNEDLGLSPDEKILLLRKKYNLDPALMETTNKSDDVKVHERKLIASKSVNDITAQNFIADENFNTRKQFKVIDYTSDPNLADGNKIVRVSREQQFLQQEQQQSSQQQQMQQDQKRNRARSKDPERRKSIIQTVSDFFHKKKDGSKEVTPSKEKSEGVFGRFKISPKSKDKSKSCFDVRELGIGDKENTPFYERSKSSDCVKHETASFNVSNPMTKIEDAAPPIPPLPLNYQRSDDESYSTNENRELKKIKAITKASRQGELKRLRIAQEIQREQEEIEVQIKDYEARGVYIEKALRGEGQNPDLLLDSTVSMGANDEKLLKELLEIWRNITQLKKRDEELGIRQQELQLEHRHAQLKEQLNMRLSCSKLDKSSADVAAEGAILNEMLEIVAKRAALRPTDTSMPGSSHDDI